MERPEPRRQVETSRPAPRLEETRRFVNIGKSIHIKGELTGNEDLTIDGTVEGKIVLSDHNLTIGANGKITAEVSAMSVVVIGYVVGDILAEDRIEVRDGGTVEGDLIAPKVVLAEGARFKGAIDMLSNAAPSRPRPQAAQTPAPSAFDQQDVPKEVVEQVVDDVLDDIVADKPAEKKSDKNTGDKSAKNDKGAKNDKNDKSGGKEPKATTGSKLADMFDEFDPSNP